MRRIYVLAAMVGVAGMVFCLTARADEGVVLRYKWVAGTQSSSTVNVDVKGTLRVSTPQGPKTTPVNEHLSVPTFVHVKEVTADGLAHLKLSYGLITIDAVMANGTAVHGEFNPADRKLVITVNGQRQVRQLPVESVDLLAKGFTPVIDDRGQVKDFGGDDVLRQMFGSAEPVNGPMNLSQMIAGLQPVLPEGKVKPGDKWQATLPLGKMLGLKSAPPAAIKYTYVGDEVVDDHPCRHISAEFEASDLSMKVPSTAAMGKLTTEITGLGIQMTTDYYLSMIDTHVFAARADGVETGTIHVTGTRKGPNGEDVAVDQTVELDNFHVASESKRM